MRVTSGKYRGREVKSPGDERTHPMGERERLALFNTLFSLIGGTEVAILDAYAGSGALGIEALSRGASRVVFVEKASTVARTIQENVRALGVGESTAQVICADVNKMTLDEEFDVILADPPYDRFDALEVAKLTKYLKNGGALVLSHPGVAPEFEGLTLEKTRAYARAHLSFYTK